MTPSILRSSTGHLWEVFLSCNGCGKRLQEGERMVCKTCDAWLTFEEYYGMPVAWPKSPVEKSHAS